MFRDFRFGRQFNFQQQNSFHFEQSSKFTQSNSKFRNDFSFFRFKSTKQSYNQLVSPRKEKIPWKYVFAGALSTKIYLDFS